jgi:hypothetical protein
MAPDNSHGGPKEIDNGDKSLRGLMVALVLAGAIAGSVILFAYASSDGSPDSASATSEVPASEPEPVIVEKVVEKPVYIERIKYVNRTIEVETPVYINRTIEVEKPVYINRTVVVEKEVPVYIEKPVHVYVNNTEDAKNTQQPRPDEREEKDDDLPEEQETIPERLQGLLDEIVDFGDNEDEKDDGNDDDGNKGKGARHYDEDDDD